jgi:hypothetical protein
MGRHSYWVDSAVIVGLVAYCAVLVVLLVSFSPGSAPVRVAGHHATLMLATPSPGGAPASDGSTESVGPDTLAGGMLAMSPVPMAVLVGILGLYPLVWAWAFVRSVFRGRV